MAAIDRARGDVPRSVWVRRAVEFALVHHVPAHRVDDVEWKRAQDADPKVVERAAEAERAFNPPRTPAPTERPRHGHVGPKRSFAPVPKGGKS